MGGKFFLDASECTPVSSLLSPLRPAQGGVHGRPTLWLRRREADQADRVSPVQGRARGPPADPCREDSGHQHAQHLFVQDRKSTRLNSSHQISSYAVFCLKKKNA